MKRFLARDEVFGYSIWNERPFLIGTIRHKQCFISTHYPYEADISCYVSEDLILILFGKDFSLGVGECVEIEITI